MEVQPSLWKKHTSATRAYDLTDSFRDPSETSLGVFLRGTSLWTGKMFSKPCLPPNLGSASLSSLLALFS